MIKVPLEAIPNQQVSVTLGGQRCQIHVYQRDRFLFMDLTVDDTVVRTGAICINGELATGYDLNNFTGKLFFVDLEEENSYPQWDGLGSRYILCYSED